MTRSVQNLERTLSELEERLKHMAEPTYVFRKGDRVSVGKLQDAIVEDVLHDGKIYLIDYTEEERKNGETIRHEHRKNYYSWLHVRKYQETQPETCIRNTGMNLRYSFRMLSDILNRVYHFGVNFDPEYQRDYVWETQDKVDLIESIFTNVDIGKFVYIQYETRKWVETGYGFEILDGKQRLKALIEFYEDRLEWRGRKFSDLSFRDQIHFTNYPVVFAEVKGLTKEQTLKYFLLVNTAGRIMSKEHLNQVRKLLDQAASE